MRKAKLLTKKDLVQIGARIPTELFSHIENERKNEGRTVTSILERALAEYFKVTIKK